LFFAGKSKVGIQAKTGFLEEGVSIVKELFRKPILDVCDLFTAPQAFFFSDGSSAHHQFS